MSKILLIEDHENISLSIKECLLVEGHEVFTANSIKLANENLLREPDLIILDWMLPDGQGLDFLRELRSQGYKIPVIFLTARIELVDKVLGLEMGANDYMTKPFESRELLARIRVQLRGQNLTEQNNILKVGSLTIDKVRHKVNFKNNEIDLVKKEYELLLLLAESPEKVFSRDEILNKVWGYEIYPTTRTVDAHIMLIRQKINNDLIETIRAVGYRLTPL